MKNKIFSAVLLLLVCFWIVVGYCVNKVIAEELNDKYCYRIEEIKKENKPLNTFYKCEFSCAWVTESIHQCGLSKEYTDILLSHNELITWDYFEISLLDGRTWSNYFENEKGLLK